MSFEEQMSFDAPMSFERIPCFAAEIPCFRLEQGIRAEHIDISRDQAAPAPRKRQIRPDFENTLLNSLLAGNLPSAKTQEVAARPAARMRDGRIAPGQLCLGGRAARSAPAGPPAPSEYLTAVSSIAHHVHASPSPGGALPGRGEERLRPSQVTCCASCMRYFRDWLK
jgi:hypothetical protein